MHTISPKQNPMGESYGILREVNHTSNGNLYFGHRPIFKIDINT